MAAPPPLLNIAPPPPIHAPSEDGGGGGFSLGGDGAPASTSAAPSRPRPLSLGRKAGGIQYPPELTAAFNVSEEVLGAGAFSQVMAGSCVSSGLPVAIKVIDLRPLRLRRAFAPSRLLREVKIQQALSHPNIVRLHNVYQSSNHLFIVQERARGRELFDAIVHYETFPEHIARSIIQQLMAAIAYLHAQHAIHRDIKPENVMLSFDGCDDWPESLTGARPMVQLVDFGLAKTIGQNVSLAKTTLGTASYIAPEVLLASRSGATYGPKVDNWSVGVVLYLLLCGRFPFDQIDGECSDSLCEPDIPVEQAILKGQFEFLRSDWEGISNAARHLVTGLLCLDPSKRLSMAEALAHPWITGVGAAALPAIPDRPTHNDGIDIVKLLAPAGTTTASTAAAATAGGGSSGLTTPPSSGTGTPDSFAPAGVGAGAGAAPVGSGLGPRTGSGGSTLTGGSGASTPSAPPMSMELDSQGRVTFVTPDWLEAFGYSQVQVLGQLFRQFVSEGSLSVLQMVSVTGSCEDTPMELVGNGGVPIALKMTARCSRNERGVIEKTHVAFSVMASGHEDDPITFRLNNNFKVVSVSDSLVDLLGYDSEEDVLGARPADFMVPQCATYLVDTLVPAVRVTGSSSRAALTFKSNDSDACVRCWVDITRRMRKDTVSGFAFTLTPFRPGEQAEGGCGDATPTGHPITPVALSPPAPPPVAVGPPVAAVPPVAAAVAVPAATPSAAGVGHILLGGSVGGGGVPSQPIPIPGAGAAVPLPSSLPPPPPAAGTAAVPTGSSFPPVAHHHATPGSHPGSGPLWSRMSFGGDEESDVDSAGPDPLRRDRMQTQWTDDGDWSHLNDSL